MSLREEKQEKLEEQVKNEEEEQKMHGVQEIHCK
jgi:hypothetical protein